MNPITYKIKLNAQREGSQASVYVKKGDARSRQLTIFLYDGINPYEIEDGLTVVLRATKPDSTLVFTDCIIEGNIIKKLMPAQMMAVAGTVACELNVYGANNEVLFSPEFNVYVSDPLTPDDDIISTNEFSALTEAMTNLETLEGDVTEAEALRVSAETGRDTAEGLRVSAETERASAESDRAAAETLRIAAETGRDTAEGERVSAEVGRNAAEDARVAAETARDTAEDGRAVEEAARDTAEDSRIAAEALRAAAEEARDTAEDARDAAETVRAGAEIVRESAESDRSTAETERENAEDVRIAAENLRALAEGNRESAETARDEAESERVAAEADRAAQFGTVLTQAEGSVTAAAVSATTAAGSAAAAAASAASAEGSAQTAAGAVTTHNAAADAHGNLFAMREAVANKVTALSGDSTDEQYPSAKCVYDELHDIKDSLFGRYGVSGVGGSAPALTRLWDSVGKTSAVSSDTTLAASDFDDIPPFNRRKCVGAWAAGADRAVFTPQAYYGDPDYTEDGTKGDYVCVDQPPVYVYRDMDNGILGVSGGPHPGWTPHPACVDADGHVREHTWLPCYALAVNGGKAVSLPGLRNAFGAYKALWDAAKTYTNAGAFAILEPSAVDDLEYLLQIVEFATQDLQSVMSGAADMRMSNDIPAILSATSCVVSSACGGAMVIGQNVAINTNIWLHGSTHKITAIQDCDIAGDAMGTGYYKLTLEAYPGATDITTITDPKISSRP